MYLFFNNEGILKEIINDTSFRNGDELSDKIYVYWDGTHAINQGYVKYQKADGTLTTETTFSLTKVGKELPAKPLRNFEFFSYDHTYKDIEGNIHVGYQFYELTVPTEVLSSATATAKLCFCLIRFVMDDLTTIKQLGTIPFSVEATAGIIPDNSINETQYNEIMKLLGGVSSVVGNPVGTPTEILNAIKIGSIIYKLDMGLKLKDIPNNKSYKITLEVKSDGKCHLVAEQI